MADAKIKKTLEAGSEIAGAVTRAAISRLEDPSSPYYGAVLGVLVTRALKEVASRFLSEREEIRVGAASSYLVEFLDKKLQRGEKLRDDGFFTNVTPRTKAEELFEGILIKCKNDHEENKIPYVSYLFSYVATNSSLSAGDANSILRTVEQVTFRQLTEIAMVGQNGNNIFALRNIDYKDHPESVNGPMHFLLQELFELSNLGIIRRSDDTAMLETLDVVPGLMELTELGETFFHALNLQIMPEAEFGYLQLLK